MLPGPIPLIKLPGALPLLESPEIATLTLILLKYEDSWLYTFWYPSGLEKILFKLLLSVIALGVQEGSGVGLGVLLLLLLFPELLFDWLLLLLFWLLFDLLLLLLLVFDFELLVVVALPLESVIEIDVLTATLLPDERDWRIAISFFSLLLAYWKVQLISRLLHFFWMLAFVKPTKFGMVVSFTVETVTVMVSLFFITSLFLWEKRIIFPF